jgi:molecular chaperone GrpE (heat shock protein)
MTGDPPDGGAPAPDAPAREDNSAPEPVLSVLSQLAEKVDREHERAAFRESIIDRLHAENQELRRDQLDTALEPVRTLLYRLHATLLRETRRWASGAAPGIEHVPPLLSALADDVAETLERTGVEPFAVEVGDRFDPSRHRPREAVEVTDPNLVDAVVEVLTVAFARGDRVVRRADVTVGRAASSPTDTRDEPDGRP